MPDDSNRTGWRNADGVTIRAALNEPTRIEGRAVHPVRFESLIGRWEAGGMITVPDGTFSTDRPYDSRREHGYVVRESYLLAANWGPILRHLNEVITAPRRTDELDVDEAAFLARHHLHTGRVLDAIRAHRASPARIAAGYPRTLRDYTETGSTEHEMLTRMRRADRLNFYRRTSHALNEREYRVAWEDYRISRASITRVRRNEAARVDRRRAQAERRREAERAELARTRAEREQEYQRMRRVDELIRAALFADPTADDLYGGEHDVLDETPAAVATELAALGVQTQTVELRRQGVRTRIAEFREHLAEKARITEVDEANMRIMLPVELMEQWSDHGHIEFRAASGHWYRLVGRNHGLTGNVHIIDEPGGRMRYSVCAHPELPIGTWTMAGVVLAQYLALTTDEDAFLLASNRIEGDFPYRATLKLRAQEGPTEQIERERWGRMPSWVNLTVAAPADRLQIDTAVMERLARLVVDQTPEALVETVHSIHVDGDTLGLRGDFGRRFRVDATRTPNPTRTEDRITVRVHSPETNQILGYTTSVRRGAHRNTEQWTRLMNRARLAADAFASTRVLNPADLIRPDIVP